MTINTIELLGRAILAQLSPLTGTRATGAVTATATAAAAVPANTYLLPIVGGQLRDDLVFKTVGDYSLAAPEARSLGIISNVGGARHNLPAGTVFRFATPIEGLEPTATLDADMLDGSGADALVKAVSFFEDLDATNTSEDIFAGMLTEFPALMLAWQESTPVEGVVAGLRQGGNRVARNVRGFRESFVLYIIAGRLASSARRRQEGLLILDAVTALLMDQQSNDDGEVLSTIGSGVELGNRTRYKRGPNHYIYAVRLSVNQTRVAVDRRVFKKWLTSSIGGSVPGREAPEPTAPLEDVPIVVDMPQE